MMRNGRNVTRSPPTYSIKKTLQFRSGMNVLGKALRPGVCVCYWWLPCECHVLVEIQSNGWNCTHCFMTLSLPFKFSCSSIYPFSIVFPGFVWKQASLASLLRLGSSWERWERKPSWCWTSSTAWMRSSWDSLARSCGQSLMSHQSSFYWPLCYSVPLILFFILE